MASNSLFPSPFRSHQKFQTNVVCLKRQLHRRPGPSLFYGSDFYDAVDARRNLIQLRSFQSLKSYMRVTLRFAKLMLCTLFRTYYLQCAMNHTFRNIYSILSRSYLILSWLDSSIRFDMIFCCTGRGKCGDVTASFFFIATETAHAGQVLAHVAVASRFRAPFKHHNQQGCCCNFPLEVSRQTSTDLRESISHASLGKLLSMFSCVDRTAGLKRSMVYNMWHGLREKKTSLGFVPPITSCSHSPLHNVESL